MIKKETLKQYVDGFMYQQKCEEELFEVLKTLNNDNYNISLLSEVYFEAIESLLNDVMGDTAFDHLQWLLYETNFNKNNTYGVEPKIYNADGKVLHHFKTLDDFWKFIKYETSKT
jgi:hypothetical protein